MNYDEIAEDIGHILKEVQAGADHDKIKEHLEGLQNRVFLASVGW